ncbi:MAG: hypothetical protein V4635_07370 [Bacteroidota bacterium]
MKKKFSYFVLPLVLLSSGTLFSQKCEVAKDPFTSERTVVSNYGDKIVYFENKAGKLKMEMVFTYAGGIDVTMAKGAEVLYKLENEQTVKLVSVNESLPKRIITQASTQLTTNYSYVFDITVDDLKKFAASKVVFIRFPDTKGGTSDFEGKNGKGLVKAIMKGAECMVENFK